MRLILALEIDHQHHTHEQNVMVILDDRVVMASPGIDVDRIQDSIMHGIQETVTAMIVGTRKEVWNGACSDSPTL